MFKKLEWEDYKTYSLNDSKVAVCFAYIAFVQITYRIMKEGEKFEALGTDFKTLQEAKDACQQDSDSFVCRYLDLGYLNKLARLVVDRFEGTDAEHLAAPLRRFKQC